LKLNDSGLSYSKYIYFIQNGETKFTVRLSNHVITHVFNPTINVVFGANLNQEFDSTKKLVVFVKKCLAKIRKGEKINSKLVFE
jgi:hypothetical protein